MDFKHRDQSVFTHKRPRPSSTFRRFPKRRKFSKKLPSAEALMALKMVRSMNKAREVKVFQDPPATSTVVAAGVIFPIGRLAQGDSQAQRDGNSVSIFKLSFRFLLIINASDANGSTWRVIFVRDKIQVQGGTPAILDILSSNNVVSMYKADNRKRFDILYDVTGVITQTDPVSLGAFVRKMQVKATYFGSVASDVLTNGFYVMVISSEPTNFPTFTTSAEILYNDS